MGPSGKAWTQAEDELLRQEILAGTTAQAITVVLGRSASAVRTRAHILRLTFGRPGTKRGPAAMALEVKTKKFAPMVTKGRWKRGFSR